MNVADWVLEQILAHGYVALSATLLLGAFGAPVPSGLAMTLAGTLIASGEFTWTHAFLVGTAASVLGDALGFVIGRWLGAAALQRHGAAFGLGPDRLSAAANRLDRWAPAAIVVSHSLLSAVSSAVNLVAGAIRIRAWVFVALDALARAAWAAAYLSLGYAVGEYAPPIAELYDDLLLLLVSLTLVAAAVVGLFRLRRSHHDTAA